MAIPTDRTCHDGKTFARRNSLGIPPCVKEQQHGCQTRLSAWPMIFRCAGLQLCDEQAFITTGRDGSQGSAESFEQNRSGSGGSAWVPYFPMMSENNARQGFFEHSDFESVVAELPEPINDIPRFGYLSGWRRGEIVPLRWDAVDRTAREVRLRTSKNGLGRVLPLEGELWTIIERRWAARTVEQEDGTNEDLRASLSSFW